MLGSFIVLLLTTVLSCSNAMGQDHNFGLGVIIGEPTGISGKYWSGQTTAIDGAIAWSLGKHGRLHLHADYLLHNFSLIKVENGQVPVYYGIGGRIKLGDDERDDKIGVRIPVGLAYIFADGRLDAFLEIGPVLDLVPETDLDLCAGLGIRFLF